MIYLDNKPRWTIIISSLIFMALSAMFSAHAVHKNDNKINTLNRKIAQQNDIITSLWKNTETAENRLQMVALYSAIARNHNDSALKKFADQYADYITPKSQQKASSKDMSEILNELNTIRNQSLERINEIFLENLRWEENIAKLKQKNTFFVNFALFIQLLSVAIITITRDLKR